MADRNVTFRATRAGLAARADLAVAPGLRRDGLVKEVAVRSKMAFLVAVLAVGCGGSTGSPPPSTARAATADPSSAAKPDDVPVAARGAPRDVRPGDLEVSVSGPAWIGPLRQESVEEYPLVLQVRNTTREPLRIGPALASVDVFEGARPLQGCDGEARAVDLPEILPPSGTAMVRVSLPCALESASEYDVVVELLTGEDDVREASLLDARFADAMTLHVDEDVGAYGADVVPTAPIYGPHPGTLPTPAPLDVRPGTEVPSTPPSGSR